jgi:hypothetical protein
MLLVSIARRLLVAALMFALVVPSVPLLAAGSAAQSAGLVAGTARSPTGQAIPRIAMQLRNLQTGEIVGTTISDTDGLFRFEGLQPGTYAAEILNAAGEVVGASASVVLSAPAMVATGLTATAVGGGLAGAGIGAGFLTSAWGLVTIAAIGAGVVGVTVAARPNASPSR